MHTQYLYIYGTLHLHISIVISKIYDTDKIYFLIVVTLNCQIIYWYFST